MQKRLAARPVKLTTEPPVRGTNGHPIVENTLNCKGPPCGFNYDGSRGAPKKWPKYRTPTCIRHVACGGGGPFGSRALSPKNTRTLNREADALRLSNYITPGKFIPKPD